MRGWAKLGIRIVVLSYVLICSPSALPHHAFAQTFVFERVVKIEGSVAEFLFRNPHSVVLVSTSGENGRMAIWAAEWGGAGQLSRQGIEKSTLIPGDHVIIIGNPSRNSADRRMLLQSLTRSSDGWRWTSGSQ